VSSSGGNTERRQWVKHGERLAAAAIAPRRTSARVLRQLNAKRSAEMNTRLLGSAMSEMLAATADQQVRGVSFSKIEPNYLERVGSVAPGSGLKNAIVSSTPDLPV
jgi:hypothetical protein